MQTLRPGFDHDFLHRDLSALKPCLTFDLWLVVVVGMHLYCQPMVVLIAYPRTGTPVATEKTMATTTRKVTTILDGRVASTTRAREGAWTMQAVAVAVRTVVEVEAVEHPVYSYLSGPRCHYRYRLGCYGCDCG